MANSKSKIATSKRQYYNQDGMWRPKSAQKQTEKSTPSSAIECPHCGEDIETSFVICPHCGRSLTLEKCSFCGAAMKPTSKFCTKCGQPRAGIECQACGTLNSRNFCRICNAPLTPMAQKAIEIAKNDPTFKQIQAKADELASLHAQIEELRNTQTTPTPPELTDEDKSLLDEYTDILASIGTAKSEVEEQSHSEDRKRRTSKNLMNSKEQRINNVAEHPKAIYPENNADYTDPAELLEKIMKAYREKAAEMNEALAALAPPPDYTPEQQRDYYSARKIVTKEVSYDADMTGYRPSVWCCNYCGCKHNCPSECAQPELGGTWIYTTPEEFARKYGTVNVSLRIS